jgi:site-specific recombinase XerD
MKKSQFNQGVSVKVFMHDHERADHTSTIYLRVTIDRRKREFNLKISWPKEFWDKDRHEAKPRHGRDKEVESVNMVINEAKGRATRIKLRYFTDSKALSLDIFQQEFENYESRDNFLFYWLKKQNEQFNKGLISKGTMIRHNTNLVRFKEFLGNPAFFSMSGLTNDLMLQFQNWLRKKKLTGYKENRTKGLKYNTAVNSLKNVKTYINHAIADGYKITDPFDKITLRYQPGERQALERCELERLRNLLHDQQLSAIEKEILRKFLFSCYTGLRISDNAQITAGMIRNGSLTVNMAKGRRYGKKVSIPLPKFALELINGRHGQLFDTIADQTCNDWLKFIAVKADIKKRLTFHVSRDTFATLFIEMGGDVFTLKDILGHGSIQTTQIYVKMSERRKENLMRNFDDL